MREESRFLSFSGTRVHFCVIRPDVPVRNRLMLLSSPLTGTFHYRKLLPELDGLGCLTVLADLPGFGKGDPGAPQDNDARAGMLWGVLDDVDRAFGAPLSLWHLGGHGLACAAVLSMAALYPDSVKSQIHIAPLFSLAPPAKRAADTPRWFRENVLDAPRFKQMIERYAGFPLDDYIVDRMRAPLLRPGGEATFERMLRQSAAPPKVGMGFCPTMALIGRRDPLMDEPRLSQIRTLLADAELQHLPSAGHFPMETHSKALRDYLRGWIRYNE